MNENLKRLLSFLMVAAMVVSMMPVTAGAETVETAQTSQETVQEAPQQTAEADLPAVSKVETQVQMPVMATVPVSGTLTPDVQQNVYVEKDATVRLAFTPAQSDVYIFQSKSDQDTYGYLYAADGSELSRNDDGGDGGNFRIVYELQAGVTYYLEVRFYSDDDFGTIPVSCRQSPLVSLEFSPVSVVENTNGYNSGSYYRYREEQIVCKSTYTATLRDGTVLTGSDTGFIYEGDWYEFSWGSEQSSYHPWTVGNTYYVNVYAMEITAQVPVTIVESPVKAVRAEPLTVKKNGNGDWEWGSNGEYFRYYWYKDLQYTVEFKDGTVRQGTFEQPVEYNGDLYGVESRSDDQYNVHWEVNNTYEATAKIAGMQVTVYVTVSNQDEDNGYQYLIQGDEVIITGCRLQTQILQIPETLEGRPVTGVVSLGEALAYAREIRIPDVVSMLSEGFLWGEDVAVEKLTLGSGISSVSVAMLQDAEHLSQIQVAADNSWLCSIDGVVYDKNATTMLLYPPAKQQQHKIPNTVTNADILLQPDWEYAQLFANVDVALGTGISDYKLVDGVIYTADMKIVVRSTASATGDYVMPESVEQVMDNAFMNSNLTSVKISSKVTDVVYAMFSGAQIQEVTIPESVEYISEYAFADCENLQRVNITDLTAWCDIWFDWTEAYPLECGADLYVNGRLIRDLVIPETVSSISEHAFRGGSFTSVTIPAGVTRVGYDAFRDCEDLEKVYITDLAAWCGISFDGDTANPLLYARDLYLNGKLVRDLVIPETVVGNVYDVTDAVYGVGEYAFVNASIESVTLPEKIERIGYGAFEGCYELEKVDVPSLETWCGIEFQDITANPLCCSGYLYVNGQQVKDLVIPEVSRVRSYAFSGSIITSVTVPSSVYYIEESAFYSSTLERITFAEGLQGIYYDAFSESDLKSVVLPDSLEWIDSYAFAWCWDLESVTFGDNLYEIGWEAFAYTGLKSVTLPDSLGYLGEGAFYGCVALKELNLGEGIQNIYQYTFASTGLEELTVPAQVEWIADWAFSESQLKEVTFLGEEVYVGGCAFDGCPLGVLDLGDNVIVEPMGFAGTHAVQIQLPETVTNLTYREFAFNKNLVSVTIPDTVTEIGADVFAGDISLSHVLYTGTQSQWNEVLCESPEILNATLHCDAQGNEVTVTETCTTVTLSCTICNTYETIRKPVPTHTNKYEMTECALCGHTGDWEYSVDPAAGTVIITGWLSNGDVAEIPDTIEDLPVTGFTADTFAYNQNLYEVVLGSNITKIPENAFRSCSNLHWVSGEYVTDIGDYAFYDCSELYNVQWSQTLESIGEYAFAHSGVAYLPYLENLKSIGQYAFWDTNLYNVELAEGITRIAEGTFLDCYGLEEVYLPASVTEIAYYAFNNTGIRELTVPAKVESIGFSAFGSTELEYIYFMGEKPIMEQSFRYSNGPIAFYPDKESWKDFSDGELRPKLCQVPEVVELPQVVMAEEGETAVAAVEANGQRLSYQWFLAAPGSNTYNAVDGNSFELSLEMNAATTGSRAYCMITDMLGQSVVTDTVTLKITPKLTGIALTQLPYTLEYDLRQQLRTRGLEVVKTFSDDSVEPLADYTVTGYDPNKSGEQTVTVTWQGYTAAFTVTVNAEKVNYTAATDTQERIEISVPQNAVEEGAELVVEKLENEEVELPETIRQNEAVVFDIFFEKNEQVVQPTENVRVEIPVPAEMESKRCKVFHVKDDGTTQDMDAVYKDGYLVFDTNHFSYYAVVQMEGVSVSGQVSGANTDGAVVKLMAGGEVLETVNVDNGTYCFKNVVDNDYVIRVQKNGRAPKDYELTVGLEDVLLDVLLAILGDIDGNEAVTTDDVIALLLHVSMPAMFPIDAEADFVKDGALTTDDVIALLLHVSMPEMFPLA